MVPAPENMMKDFIETMIGPFTDLIGDWFWAIIMFSIVGAIYLRTDSWGPPMAVMVTMSALLTSLLNTEVRYFFAIMAVLGVAGLLYSMYRRRQG